MSPGIRNGLAGTAGLIAGGMMVAVVEAVSSLVYPFPEGLDPYDSPAMSEYVRTLPTGAFLFILAGWLLGAVVSTATGRRLAADRSPIPGLAACGLLLLATVVTLMNIAHPAWMNIAGIAVYPIGAAAVIAISEIPRVDSP